MKNGSTNPRREGAPADPLTAALAAMLAPVVEAAVARALAAHQQTPWLDREQAAEYLGVTIRTLDNIRKEPGAPKEGRAGDSPRWRREDLDAYMARGSERESA